MATQASDRPPSPRVTQLAIGVLCMVAIANLQYGWTLFVQPMSDAHGWAPADIQIAFSIFVALETWLAPVAGWIADSLGPRLGPKLVVTVGGVLIAIAWIINARAQSLSTLYLGAGIAGIGAGAVYAICIGNAVKWFADRRGFAVGMTAAGFGAGAALTVIPIRSLIASHGYEAAFFWFGLLQGVVVFVLGLLLRAPLPGETVGVAPAKVGQSAHSYTPREMLQSPIFWLLYLMFILVSASGLMATAQIALVAKDYKVADTVLLLGASTLTLALLIDNVANGVARPLFGWISDRLGREYTMAIAFGLGGVSYWLLGVEGTAPWTFVICTGLIFLTWGEIFSLFPSTCADTFGPTFATVNTGLLYTAKGTSAFLVPFANVLAAWSGGWRMVFVMTAVMNLLVVGLALFVLRPLRSRHLGGTQPRTLAQAH